MSQSSASFSMLGFVPAIVIEYLMKLNDNKNYLRQLPEKQSFKSVVMFADISGFTNLTETLSKIGPEGAEVIAFAINRYMELLVKGIGRSGGDIFKFAGDAMIVIWPPPKPKNNQPPSDKDLETLCKQALQSALDLQAKLNDTNILENIKLSVKIGFGIGDITIIHVGGVFQRTEYIATGDPLIQAFGSEHCCTAGGQTIVSNEVYDMVSNHFEFTQITKEHEGHEPLLYHQALNTKQNYSKVKMKADALLITNNINLTSFEKIKGAIQSYIPAALIPFIEIDEESWSSELRLLTIMFVNLGIDLSLAKSDTGLAHIQAVIETVQKSVYMHEGSLNKLLMDDKGSTLIVVFGLPPMSHQDDATRAILTAFSMSRELQRIKCPCSIGIATGTVFAGVVGTSGSRREYSVLGDSVNLAARLMQTACSEKQQKIIICENTSRHCEHKLPTVYFKAVSLKGKAHPIPIYYPLDVSEDQLRKYNKFNLFPELKTHRLSLPVYEISESEDKLVKKIFNEENLKQRVFTIGRDDIHKKVQTLLDKFLKDVERKAFILLRGSYGTGKTLFLRRILYRIQEKIDSNQYNFTWKYGEKSRILVQSLDPINKDNKLCGLRNILKGFFHIMAARDRTSPDDLFLTKLVEKTSENTEAYELLQECLGLKQFNRVENFPPKMDLTPPDKKEKKEKVFASKMKYVLIEFLAHYFEDVPEKYKEIHKKFIKLKDPVRQSVRQNRVLSNIIAPIIICFDDMQNYDELSFYLIRIIIKIFERVLMIGLVRDQFLDLSYFKSDRTKHKTQEDVFISNIQQIEDVVEQSQLHRFVLRGLQRLEKEDELLQLLRKTFNISTFDLKVKRNQAIEPIEPKASLIDIQQQDMKRQVLTNHYLFHENKPALLEKDIPLLLLHFMYLKTQGNPHMGINLFYSLINQKLLTIVDSVALIDPQMIYILDNEEMLTVDAPLCRVQVNGPLIDRLTCLESLLMKAASVIGEIFDIQTLNRIHSLRMGVNQEQLIRLLNDLQNKEIIELMSITKYNTYYRFIYPFMRECLYQRMTFNQRRKIHLNVAETILPLVSESEEAMENKKQEFHWRMAEQRWSLNEEKTEDEKIQIRESKYGLTKMSYKAMKSIIVRQIQNRLAKFNNDHSTIIKEGNLYKKSLSNFTWAERYCVMDGKEFKYYYSVKEAQENQALTLCSFLLKNIYAIVALNDGEKTNKNFAFYISCSSWFKGNKEQRERKFYFAAYDELSLQQWTIFLEFSRAKAIYEEFVKNFGKIQFPIGSPIDSFDMAFKNDVEMKSFKYVNSFNPAQQDGRAQTSKFSVVARQSRSSKFMMHKQQVKTVQKDFDEQQGNFANNPMSDFPMLKERLKVFLQKSMLLFYSNLFDMSIQKQDEYKVFGQTNSAMKKLTIFFKVDKKLCQQDVKNSIMRSSMSNSEQQQQFSQTSMVLNESSENIKRQALDSSSLMALQNLIEDKKITPLEEIEEGSEVDQQDQGSDDQPQQEKQNTIKPYSYLVPAEQSQKSKQSSEVQRQDQKIPEQFFSRVSSRKSDPYVQTFFPEKSVNRQSLRDIPESQLYRKISEEASQDNDSAYIHHKFTPQAAYEDVPNIRILEPSIFFNKQEMSPIEKKHAPHEETSLDLQIQQEDFQDQIIQNQYDYQQERKQTFQPYGPPQNQISSTTQKSQSPQIKNIQIQNQQQNPQVSNSSPKIQSYINKSQQPSQQQNYQQQSTSSSNNYQYNNEQLQPQIQQNQEYSQVAYSPNNQQYQNQQTQKQRSQNNVAQSPNNQQFQNQQYQPQNQQNYEQLQGGYSPNNQEYQNEYSKPLYQQNYDQSAISSPIDRQYQNENSQSKQQQNYEVKQVIQNQNQYQNKQQQMNHQDNQAILSQNNYQYQNTLQLPQREQQTTQNQQVQPKQIQDLEVKGQQNHIETQTHDVNFTQAISYIYPGINASIQQQYAYHVPAPAYQQFVTHSGMNQNNHYIPHSNDISPVHSPNISPATTHRVTPLHLSQQHIQSQYQIISQQPSMNQFQQYQYPQQEIFYQQLPELKSTKSAVIVTKKKSREASLSQSKSNLNQSKSKSKSPANSTRVGEKRHEKKSSTKLKSSSRKKTYFGIVKRSCTSLRGDIFTLDVGQKERGYAECSSGGSNGIFKLEDLTIQEVKNKPQSGELPNESRLKPSASSQVQNQNF